MGGRVRPIINGLKSLFLALVLIWTITPAKADEPLLIFAAVSLKDALEPIAQDFEENTGIDVRLSFAGTSTLARQLSAGAPADIFISADDIWMTWLNDRKLVDAASETIIARNRLALVAPSDTELESGKAPLKYLEAFLANGSGRIALADPDHVPAGRYAIAALSALIPTIEQHRRRFATSENVRLTALLVGRGETPLGIVYKSDALLDPRLKELALFEEDTHAPIAYPAAITKNARFHARAFLTHLKSISAKRHIQAAGLVVN